jgi:apolipoprotein N-acyltransferase
MSERPKEVPLGRSAASSASGQSKAHPCHCEPQAKQSKAHIKHFILAFLSGILLSLSFSSFKLSFFAWIGLVPLFCALKDKNLKQSFVLSFACGVFFFLFSMYWLYYVTPVGWIILSLYQGLYFAIFGLVFSATSLHTKYYILHTKYLILSCAWCLLEYVRANLFGGIGWNLLAYSQYEQLPIIQIADITGAYGVSFLIVFVNLAICSILSILNNKVKAEVKVKIVLRILVIFIIFILALFYGYSRIAGFSFKDIKSNSITLSLIQGNIAQTHKWDAQYKDYILDTYSNFTLKAAQDKPDMIIWPETSIPGYLNKDSRLMRYMETLSRQARAPILAGTPMVDIDDKAKEVELNSAVLFSDKGHILQRYDKLHLVMFGEFIPFERYFPGIRKFLPITGNFIPGDEYTIFQLTALSSQPSVGFGVLVCFEDIFPGIVRRFIRKGAFFMVNITNDAWFGKSAAPYQHAANSVFRAIENRRPFVRAANTGLTCFIDRVGRLSSLRISPKDGSVIANPERLVVGEAEPSKGRSNPKDSAVIASRRRSNPRGKELFVEGYITDNIHIDPNPALTFYTRYGDIFILFCLFIVGCFLIDYLRYRKYNN